jgi:hypothetical protein
VLDNASYHNVKTEDTVWPNFRQNKAVHQNCLTQHSIPFSATDPETLNLSRQSNPHFAHLHAKQSNVCLFSKVFLGQQTHHSEATYLPMFHPCTRYITLLPYHNVKTEDTVWPNFRQNKAVHQNCLTQHSIPFSATDTKQVLYEKINQEKIPVVSIILNMIILHSTRVVIRVIITKINDNRLYDTSIYSFLCSIILQF